MNEYKVRYYKVEKNSPAVRITIGGKGDIFGAKVFKNRYFAELAVMLFYRMGVIAK